MARCATFDSSKIHRQAGRRSARPHAQDGARGLPPGAPLPSLIPPAAKTTQLPDVTIIAPPAPTDPELNESGLFQFIVHHGATHYSSAAGAIGGGLLRWRGGRAETICPASVGLDEGYNDFVTARVRAVAGFVGAPIQSDLKCYRMSRLFSRPTRARSCRRFSNGVPARCT
jgi:hypothetical protein